MLRLRVYVSHHIFGPCTVERTLVVDASYLALRKRLDMPNVTDVFGVNGSSVKGVGQRRFVRSWRQCQAISVVPDSIHSL